MVLLYQNETRIQSVADRTQGSHRGRKRQGRRVGGRGPRQPVCRYDGLQSGPLGHLRDLHGRAICVLDGQVRLFGLVQVPLGHASGPLAVHHPRGGRGGPKVRVRRNEIGRS